MKFESLKPLIRWYNSIACIDYCWCWIHAFCIFVIGLPRSLPFFSDNNVNWWLVTAFTVLLKFFFLISTHFSYIHSNSRLPACLLDYIWSNLHNDLAVRNDLSLLFEKGVFTFAHAKSYFSLLPPKVRQSIWSSV